MKPNLGFSINYIESMTKRKAQTGPDRSRTGPGPIETGPEAKPVPHRSQTRLDRSEKFFIKIFKFGMKTTR